MGLFGKPPGKCCCGGTTCCTERCYGDLPGQPATCTGAPGENPMPDQLTVETSTDSAYGCWVMSATVTQIQRGRWAGTLNGTCTFCCPSDSTLSCTRYFCSDIFIQCGLGGWLIELNSVAGCHPADPSLVALQPSDTELTKASCNPILLTGLVCWDAGLICTVPGPGVPPPPIIHPVICLSVTVSEVL